MKTLVYTKTTGCPIINPLLGAATVMVMRGGGGEDDCRPSRGGVGTQSIQGAPIHLYFTFYYTEDTKYW